MDKQSIPENQEVEVPAVNSAPAEAENNAALTPEVVEEQPKKRRFWQSPRFILGVIFTLVLVGLGVWFYMVLQTNNQANTYKEAYDIAVEELRFCNSIEGTSQSRDVFAYCDRLEEKFREVER